MGKLGSMTAFTAEAALWVTGAALIASAAGAHWDFDPSGQISRIIAGPTASPGQSSGPTLAPGASPTIAPTVQKFMAFMSNSKVQYKVKLSITANATVAGKALSLSESGTDLHDAAGNESESLRMTANGEVTTTDSVNIGGTKYLSENGGPWTKSPRGKSDNLLDGSITFVEAGTETKNGEQLHRLDLADTTAFTKSMMSGLGAGAGDAQFTLSAWVHDDGTPALVVADGWGDMLTSGIKVRLTMRMEMRFIPMPSVTITAPI